MFTDELRSRPLRIVVLSGGTSAERDVSLESGRHVATALMERGHRVELVDPRETSFDTLAADTDIILPMLHGTNAEDGVLQRQLDSRGIPWLGSSAAASELTFNKIATRTVLMDAGLPVAPGVALSRYSSVALIHEAARSVGFPLVVKPAEQGSSVGISIIHHKHDLDRAVHSATQWGSRFLIEQYIVGREVTVPVIDDCVFPAVEIIPNGSWYDYNAKYLDQATRYSVAPAGLPAGLNEIVLRACRACGVGAISRTDLRLDEWGRCWILEINTIPGMTSHSLIPMSAQAMGVSVGELCEQLLLRRLGRVAAMPWEPAPEKHIAKNAA
jgi:D-alanine-D-alanine ligase